MIDLENLVHRALDNAVLNEYEDLFALKDEEIADDLVTYDADLEGQDPKDLVPHVRSWKERHR